MKATLLKSEKHPSKYGSHFWYLFWKAEDTKSYRTCLYPHYGNFARWQNIIGKEGLVVDNLTVRGKLIDADSWPKIIEQKILEKTS